MATDPEVQEAHRPTFSIERIAVPVSGLAGWGIVICGILTSLHVLGINIQPLLTVGGVGGVAIGFGAQTVTANIVSGINLVRSQLPASLHMGACRLCVNSAEIRIVADFVAEAESMLCVCPQPMA